MEGQVNSWAEIGSSERAFSRDFRPALKTLGSAERLFLLKSSRALARGVLLSRLIYPPNGSPVSTQLYALWPRQRGPPPVLARTLILDLIRVPVRTERRSKADSTN